MFNTVAPIVLQKSSSCFHRIILPLENGGFNFDTIKDRPASETLVGKNILFFNKTSINPDVLSMAKEKLKCKVVMDIDDDWIIPVQHIDYAMARKRYTAEASMLLLEMADVVITTTDRLAKRAAEHCENVWVIPNTIPFEGPGSEAFKPVDKQDGPVKFGWVGGVSHYRDLKTISGVFRAFPKLSFTMCGYYNVDGVNNIWDKMEAICSNDRHNKNYIRRFTMPLNAYMKHYDRLDVVFAPLEHTEFNMRKSALKIYEAGAKKCAAIVSAVPPYTDEGAPVTYCKTIADWKEAVKKHHDRGYATEMGEKLYQWVRTNRNMAVANSWRDKIFKSLTNG